MGDPDRDAPAERVPDDNRRPGLVCARFAPHFAGLADELAKVIKWRQSERPMPVKVGATTRRSRAKNGAMKLHQSAWAAPPCRNMRPGLPRSPQVRVSTSAPSTVTNDRSGSIATTRSNHAGAGGFCPRKAASGAMGLEFGHAIAP